MLGHNRPTASFNEGLPDGCWIDEHKGRQQPFTIWVPGNRNYDPKQPAHVWRFSQTREDAVAFIEREAKKR